MTPAPTILRNIDIFSLGAFYMTRPLQLGTEE